MPFHRWLPAAMVAPTPVSALLHAVAVVKAGVFSVLKVTVYVFGLDPAASPCRHQTADLGRRLHADLMASVIALRKTTSSGGWPTRRSASLATWCSAAMLANRLWASWIGAGMQIATHAFGKITLFFCAGAIYVAAHKTEISQLDGIGRGPCR